jgi:hypothetical protein
MNEPKKARPGSSVDPPQSPPATIASDNVEASWAEGAMPSGRRRPSLSGEEATPKLDHHLQAQALLPYARSIASQLAAQEHRLQQEVTPTLDALHTLAETLPPDTAARQQAEFIVETIQQMLHDATKAQQHAQQIVANLENEVAKGAGVPERGDP